MALENLPGTFPQFIDGNLQTSEPNTTPIVLVLGTASRGTSESVYTVNTVSEAASTFGRTDGTLIRTLYEAVSGGALNLRLFRIGATSAKLTGVGTGITIETIEKDATAGTDYKLFWDDTGKRLRVWRSSDDTLVYDNNPTYPSASVDLQEVSVSGTASGTPGDIGSLSVPLTLMAASGVGGAVYTAGNDGILLSRMELFEALHKAYILLENVQIDYIIPANIYLDDSNTSDMTTAEVTALNTAAPWAASPVYPEPGTFYDALGKVFAQEYQGEWYFWWDMDRDGIAEIYPSIGSATATRDAFGTTLELGDFHEANFGYQLADFCYRKSENDMVCHGFIGVLPPVSWSLKDVSNWVGRLPTASDNSQGQSVITANGTGLLGMKWLVGRLGNGSTGLPGQVIDGIDGLYGGGFIATDSGWPDGTQQEDRNEHRIDIGKYLSVVGAQAILANSTSATSYVATGSAIYGGFVASLPDTSAPTNKVQPGVRLPFRVNVAKLDILAGAGYVMFQQKPKGVVVSDAPTAARTDSDYRRLTTFKIVKNTIESVRAAAEPSLGEGMTGARLAALETSIDGALLKRQKAGALQRYDKTVTSTPVQRVQGKADVELVLVPAFELRQITVYVSLAAQ